ncbi:MAG: hypothetical protein IT308_05565 [Anaerolineaceae bacterium]|nr:hypothetical protein [Anaerolineaceae bacterium]
MTEEKKKGLFGKAIDALTSRDEKEAAEKAQQAAQAAQNQAVVAKQQVYEAEKKAAESEAKTRELEAQLKAKEDQEKAHKLLEEMRARDAQTAAAAAAAAAPKYMAEYEVTGWDETLSHVALKYYKNATRPYWMLIYEANKAVIGDNPNIIKPGMKLNIPILPEDMK